MEYKAIIIYPDEGSKASAVQLAEALNKAGCGTFVHNPKLGAEIIRKMYYQKAPDAKYIALVTPGCENSAEMKACLDVLAGDNKERASVRLDREDLPPVYSPSLGQYLYVPGKSDKIDELASDILGYVMASNDEVRDYRLAMIEETGGTVDTNSETAAVAAEDGTTKQQEEFEIRPWKALLIGLAVFLAAGFSTEFTDCSVDDLWPYVRNSTVLLVSLGLIGGVTTWQEKHGKSFMSKVSNFIMIIFVLLESWFIASDLWAWIND